MVLRPYQERAVAQCRVALRSYGRVCLVMPTGAGKTVTAQAIAEGEDPLWLVHTTALRDQAPGRVVTIQSLLGGERPKCSLLIADECHHLAGDAVKWKAVAQDYPRVLGLTATPCRHDGAPLAEMFDVLQVGASYSELLKGGYLVPCRVVRPVDVPEEDGIADEPARAWLQWAGGDLFPKRGFAFFGRVPFAERFARRIPRSGIITGEQPHDDRQATMDRFRRGELTVLSSVQCLTEGVDVPEAEVCMLARGVSHEGAYLQAVGRVLRPAPGKTEALLIDLPGASFRFGFPTDDRRYALTGTPVSRADGAPAVSQCLKCGSCYPSAPVCPCCGYRRPAKAPRVRVWGVPLEEVRGDLTPKQRAQLEWRKRMEADAEARRAWFAGCRRRMPNPKQAAAVFKGLFGRWPDAREGWSWRR